jgi:hypothetical protein
MLLAICKVVVPSQIGRQEREDRDPFIISKTQSGRSNQTMREWIIPIEEPPNKWLGWLWLAAAIGSTLAAFWWQS